MWRMGILFKWCMVCMYLKDFVFWSENQFQGSNSRGWVLSTSTFTLSNEKKWRTRMACWYVFIHSCEILILKLNFSLHKYKKNHIIVRLTKPLQRENILNDLPLNVCFFDYLCMRFEIWLPILSLCRLLLCVVLWSLLYVVFKGQICCDFAT